METVVFIPPSSTRLQGTSGRWMVPPWAQARPGEPAPLCNPGCPFPFATHCVFCYRKVVNCVATLKRSQAVPAPIPQAPSLLALENAFHLPQVCGLQVLLQALLQRLPLRSRHGWSPQRPKSRPKLPALYPKGEESEEETARPAHKPASLLASLVRARPLLAPPQRAANQHPRASRVSPPPPCHWRLVRHAPRHAPSTAGPLGALARLERTAGLACAFPSPSEAIVPVPRAVLLPSRSR